MKIKLIIRIIGGLIVLYLIVALYVSWSETENHARLAAEQHELFLKEKDISEKLKMELDSCQKSQIDQAKSSNQVDGRVLGD